MEGAVWRDRGPAGWKKGEVGRTPRECGGSTSVGRPGKAVADEIVCGVGDAAKVILGRRGGQACCEEGAKG